MERTGRMVVRIIGIVIFALAFYTAFDPVLAWGLGILGIILILLS